MADPIHKTCVLCGTKFFYHHPKEECVYASKLNKKNMSRPAAYLAYLPLRVFVVVGIVWAWFNFVY